MLASLVLKTGKYFSDNIAKEIKDFYKSDENSQVMAGKKDTVTVVGGEKVKNKSVFFCLISKSFMQILQNLKIR